MYLPLELGYGRLAIYNVRRRSLFHNIQSPTGFNWGSVYQIAPFGIYSAQVGDSVLFQGSDQICQLAYATVHYPIIEEARIVTTETISFV